MEKLQPKVTNDDSTRHSLFIKRMPSMSSGPFKDGFINAQDHTKSSKGLQVKDSEYGYENLCEKLQPINRAIVGAIARLEKRAETRSV